MWQSSEEPPISLFFLHSTEISTPILFFRISDAMEFFRLFSQITQKEYMSTPPPPSIPRIHGLSRIDANASTLLPCLITHSSSVKRSDDAHFERYLFGSHTSTWISPWQATELKIAILAGDLCELTVNDVVLDLGCGDGRVGLVLGKTFGCEQIGWDCFEDCIGVANEMKAAMIEGLRRECTFKVVDFVERPVWEDLDRATVLFAYLPVQGLVRIRELIEKAFVRNPNVKLVTNEYHFPDEENWEVLATSGTIRVTRLKMR